MERCGIQELRSKYSHRYEVASQRIMPFSISKLSRKVGKGEMYVRNIQRAFGLPVLARYSQGYAELLKKIIALQTFSIPNYKIQNLMDKERKILEMLNIDSLNQKATWFEDLSRAGCGVNCLLFTGYDLGFDFDSKAIQACLDFEEHATELFTRAEVGEDIHRELTRYQEMLADLNEQLYKERDNVRKSLNWTNTVLKVHFE